MNEKNIIVELAQFSLAVGAKEEDFLKEAEVVQENFLKKQEGFIDRELLKYHEDSGEEYWMDIIHWKTMENAKKASEEMLKNPVCAGFVRMINPESVEMKHLEQLKLYMS